MMMEADRGGDGGEYDVNDKKSHDYIDNDGDDDGDNHGDRG